MENRKPEAKEVEDLAAMLRSVSETQHLLRKMSVDINRRVYDLARRITEIERTRDSYGIQR